VVLRTRSLETLCFPRVDRHSRPNRRPGSGIYAYLARTAQFDQPSTSTGSYPLNSVAQINPLALAYAATGARTDTLKPP